MSLLVGLGAAAIALTVTCIAAALLGWDELTGETMSGILTDRFGNLLNGHGPAVATPNAVAIDIAVGRHGPHAVVVILVNGAVAGAVHLTPEQARHHIDGVRKAIGEIEADQCPTESRPIDQAMAIPPGAVSTITTDEIESLDSSTYPSDGGNAGPSS